MSEIEKLRKELEDTKKMLCGVVMAAAGNNDIVIDNIVQKHIHTEKWILERNDQVNGFIRLRVRKEE